MNFTEVIPFVTPLYVITDLNYNCIFEDVQDIKNTTDHFNYRYNNNGKQTSNLIDTTLSQQYTDINSLLNYSGELCSSMLSRWGLNRKVELTNWWINIDGDSNYCSTHMHPGSIISGVYYINVPEGSGEIEFERPDPLVHYFYAEEPNETSYTIYKVQPQKGMMILFPSYIKHRVIENKFKDKSLERISLAFNYSLIHSDREK